MSLVVGAWWEVWSDGVFSLFVCTLNTVAFPSSVHITLGDDGDLSSEKYDACYKSLIPWFSWFSWLAASPSSTSTAPAATTASASVSFASITATLTTFTTCGTVETISGAGCESCGCESVGEVDLGTDGVGKIGDN